MWNVRWSQIIEKTKLSTNISPGLLSYIAALVNWLLITYWYLLTTFICRLWWHNGISPLLSSKICIICCGFIKVNGFRDSFLYGYEWIIINLPKNIWSTNRSVTLMVWIMIFVDNIVLCYIFECCWVFFFLTILSLKLLTYISFIDSVAKHT
jgi:hypothetical protein